MPLWEDVVFDAVSRTRVHNKLIRQYIPKGTDFENVSDEMLKEIVIKINKRPRLKLGFSTPVAEFFKYIA